MSRSITKIIRTIAFTGVLGATAFLGYEFVQDPNASNVVETVQRSSVVDTVKTTAESGAQRFAEQTDEARRTWEQLGVEKKVQDLQDKASPFGRKITAVVSPSFQPIKAGERRMSLPALFLILAFGSVFLLMGRFSSDGRY